MATDSLPLKTTEADIEKVAGYLKSQVGWVPVDRIKAAIPSKHADPRKIEALRFIGLIGRDGANVKLTEDGREYAAATDADGRARVIQTRLRAVPLYYGTLEWMHHSAKVNVSKTEIANYWHDHQADKIAGAQGDALTDATVFFMRLVGVSGLGKFSAAGRGRDTNLAMDEAKLEEYATGAAPPAPERETPAQGNGSEARGNGPAPPPPVPTTGFQVATGLNVRVEIHIAADAKAATIEEIFKNMRRYLIDGSPTPDGS